MHVRLWKTLLILCKTGDCPKKFSTILTECLWKTKNSPVDFFSKQHLIFYATQQFLSTLPCFHILQILFFHSPVFCSFSPLLMRTIPIDPFFLTIFIIKIPLLYGFACIYLLWNLLCCHSIRNHMTNIVRIIVDRHKRCTFTCVEHDRHQLQKGDKDIFLSHCPCVAQSVPASRLRQYGRLHPRPRDPYL